MEIILRSRACLRPAGNKPDDPNGSPDLRAHSEAAFAALVQRHVNFVYSAALRCVGNAHAAEEISQAGFINQTTRLTAANFLRGEIRRQEREPEAYRKRPAMRTGKISTPCWMEFIAVASGVKISEIKKRAAKQKTLTSMNPYKNETEYLAGNRGRGFGGTGKIPFRSNLTLGRRGQNTESLLFTNVFHTWPGRNRIDFGGSPPPSASALIFHAHGI